MINLEYLAAVTDRVEFNVELKQDEDGTYIAALNEIDDVFSYGDSTKEALRNLADDVIEYAKEYWVESFTLYFNAPNRKKHFPICFKGYDAEIAARCHVTVSCPTRETINDFALTMDGSFIRPQTITVIAKY